MSVDLELTSVLRIVLTMSVLTHAAAMQDTPSIQMDTIVMVRTPGPYIIVFNVVYSVDIDECGLGTHQCAQDCSNTVGSYTCSCQTGYTLNADGRRCDGM